MEVGVTLRYMIVSLLFGMAIVAFQASRITGTENQKIILLGFASLYVFLAAAFLILVVFGDLPGPVFVLPILTFLALSGLCLRKKRELEKP